MLIGLGRKEKLWSMKNKFVLLFTICVLASGLFFFGKAKRKVYDQESYREVIPIVGVIQNIISTTGTVLPKNRLEIKPPVSGRIEEILVKEGQKVKIGDILAWMSSTERAALLDAARGKGEDDLKYWQETYKPIPLLSPIDGEVIVSTMQPGQTVTTSAAVIVLSDYLIVRAQVDETDIGKVKLNQIAQITLDAYPDNKIKAIVEHIYYESETVNNVTVYKVDLRLASLPQFLRSGMNASIDLVEQSKENVLLISQEALQKNGKTDYVLVKQENSMDPVRVNVETGISDDNNIEIISGLDANDVVVVKSKKFSLPKTNSSGTNPFMPPRRGAASRGGGGH